ncbi:MAG: hypothetical protein OEY09_06470, partial [Gammaproteobacteria bacterium]|nr:hypothetical protein [Gammaproteobacteria bacterium]
MTSTETFDQKVFFKNCRQLIKQQKHQEARRLLSSALRRTSLDNSGILKAGRMAEGLSIDKHTRVSIYGQCTTAWLVPALQSASMAQDEAILIEDHAYDNVIQGLTMLESNIDVLILLPWHQRLFAPGDRSGDQRISEELSFWQQA